MDNDGWELLTVSRSSERNKLWLVKILMEIRDTL